MARHTGAQGKRKKHDDCQWLKETAASVHNLKEAAHIGRAVATNQCALSTTELETLSSAMVEPVLDGSVTSPHETAQAVHALARLRTGPSDAVAEAAVRNVHCSGSTFAVSQTLWAIARNGSGHALAVAEEWLLEDALALAHSMGFVDASTCAYACTRMRSDYARSTIAVMCSRICSLAASSSWATDCPTQALSNALWAAGRAGCTESRADCEYLGNLLLQTSPATPMEISSATWGAARLGCSSILVAQLCESFTHVLPQLNDGLSRSSAKSIAVACAACGIAGTARGASALAPAAVAAFDLMEAEDLCNCAWGFAQTLKLPQHFNVFPLLRPSLSTLLGSRAQYMGPSAATNASYAICALHLSANAFASVISVAAAQASALSDEQLSSCMRSCVQFHERCSDDVLETFIQRAFELLRTRACTVEHACRVFASCGCIPAIVRPSMFTILSRYITRLLTETDTMLTASTTLNLLTEAFINSAELLPLEATTIMVSLIRNRIRFASTSDAVDILRALTCVRWRCDAQHHLAEEASQLIRVQPEKLSHEEAFTFVESASLLGCDVGDARELIAPQVFSHSLLFK